jgi:hypothetical protein
MGARQKKSRKRSGTRAEQLLEDSIFVTDECLGDSVPDALRAAGWRIEKHLDHFPRGTEDVVWMPVIGERGWVSLTKDKAIRRVEAEMEKVIYCGLRMFTLPGGQYNADQMVNIFVENRLRMGRTLRRVRGPFIAVVSRSGVEVVRGGAVEDAE